MKVIPKQVFNKTSTAENKIHSLLSQVSLSDYDVALHSLNLGPNEKKRWNEADFVILSEIGIFTLEIKGGRITCNKGIWEFKNKFGEIDRKKVGPGEQAKNNHFLLEEHLFKNYKHLLSGLPMGWGAVFPDISRVVQLNISTLPELPDVISSYERHCATPGKFTNYLRGLHAHYKQIKVNQNSYEKKLSKENIQEISNFLRPDFDRVPSLGKQVKEFQDRLFSLTEEQYEKIDMILPNPRCVITGGAGTGKTFLAIYTARTHAALEKKVLLTTRSEYLASHLRQSPNLPENIHIMDINQLFEININEKYDVLIIDEGQDLCQLDTIEKFDEILEGGFDNGQWFWFGDPNNQVSSYHEFDQVIFDEWINKNSFTINLKFNVRNTPTVIKKVEEFSGVKVGDPKLGDSQFIGAGGEFKFKLSNSFEESFKFLLEYLKKLLSGQEPVSLNEICVLTKDNLAAEKLKQTFYHESLRSEIINSESLKNDMDCLLISTVENFKGLEKPIICIFDINEEMESLTLKKFFYNAFSRANHTIFLTCNKKIIEKGLFKYAG